MVLVLNGFSRSSGHSVLASKIDILTWRDWSGIPIKPNHHKRHNRPFTKGWPRLFLRISCALLSISLRKFLHCIPHRPSISADRVHHDDCNLHRTLVLIPVYIYIYIYKRLVSWHLHQRSSLELIIHKQFEILVIHISDTSRTRDQSCSQ